MLCKLLKIRIGRVAYLEHTTLLLMISLWQMNAAKNLYYIIYSWLELTVCFENSDEKFVGLLCARWYHFVLFSKFEANSNFILAREPLNNSQSIW